MMKYKLTVNYRGKGKFEYTYSASTEEIFKLCKYCLLLGQHGYEYDDIKLELIDE